MPLPTGFDNKVVDVDDVDEATFNSILTAQNNAGYWATDIKIMDSTSAVILFCKNYVTSHPGDGGSYPYVSRQAISQVSMNQAALDADKATKAVNGYVPTGMFIDPTTPGSVYILYQQLGNSST